MLHKSASGMDQGGFCLFLSEEGRKDFIKSAVARQGTYFLSLSLFTTTTSTMVCTSTLHSMLQHGSDESMIDG